MKIKKIISIVCLLLCCVCLFSGCTKKFENVGEWETQKVSKIYTMTELNEFSDEELKAMTNSYIKVKAKFRETGMLNNIYYTNYVLSLNSEAKTNTDKISIYAYSYSNYWEIKFAYGDEIYIEGYVSSFNSSANRLYINPAYVTKA